QHLIETRLLVHTTSGWIGLPYVWNDTQTQATLQLTGVRRHLQWTPTDGDPEQIEYAVPNFNECKACHIRLDGFEKKVLPIGAAKVRNLNRPYAHPQEPENQLAFWAHRGLLTDLPPIDTLPRVVAWDDA